MQPFAQNIAQRVPWFLPVFLWIVALLILLVLIALPSYFVVFPLVRDLRQAVGRYLSRMIVRHLDRRGNREQAITNVLSEFKRNSGLSFVSTRGGGTEASILTFSHSAKTLSAEIKHFLDVPHTFAGIADRLSEAAAKPNSIFPEIPNVDQLAKQHANLRIARVRLIVSSVILIAIITVNTGMLGQILRSLGFIPRDLVYFGIPLYLLFAFILTLLEAGLGYVHTVGQWKGDEPEKLSAWSALAIVLAAVIACVEGFFYTQVAPNRESLVELPFGYSVRQGILFFLWGATLVTVLFGLGKIWSDSLESISRSNASFPKLVHRLSIYRRDFADACERAEKSTEHVRAEVQDIEKVLQAGVDQANAIMVRVKYLQANASKAQDDTPEPRELTEGEVYQFVHASGLWLIVTLIFIGLIAGSAFYAVGYALPYLPTAAKLLCSLGIAGGFVVLGLLFPRNDLILDRVGNRLVVVMGSPWRIKVVLAITLPATAVLLFLVWRVRLSTYQIGVWIVVFLLGGFLAGASSQAAAMGKGLQLWFRHVNHFIRSFLEALLRFAVRINLAVVFLIELIARALASPIFLFRRRELPPLILAEPAAIGGTEQAVILPTTDPNATKPDTLS